MDMTLSNPFKRLHPDLLPEIMARLDGPALAAAACTCTEFLQVAREQRLWKHLCQSRWPSTKLQEAQCLFSPTEPAGFHKFYSDSYPLVSHTHQTATQPQNQKQPKTHVSPSDFASLIDVFYRGKCVLSRVLDGIPEAVDIEDVGDGWNSDVLADDRQRWFSDCPFKLDLLSYDCDEEDEDEDRYEELEANSRRGHPHMTPVEDGTWKEDICSELVNDVRLSWVLLDKKTGNAVNLSSWKPMSAQRSWPSEGDYMINFGCIVPVDECVLTQKLAKCTINARCRLGESESAGGMRWREISMVIEDMNGSHLSGRMSSLVLNQALYSSRSINLANIEKGFSQFEKQKQEMKKRKEFMERVVDSICLSLEVTAFLGFCYVFKLVY